jgi:hypothetical protein
VTRFTPSRHGISAAVAALLIVRGGLAIGGAEPAAAVPDASEPPPGVIIDVDAAAPLAPDPETLYIKLLTAAAPAPRPDGAAVRPAQPATRADREPAQEPPPSAASLHEDEADETVIPVVAAAGDESSDKASKNGGKARKSPCEEESKECREALTRLRDDALSDIALDIRVGGRPGSDYPCECRLEGETFEPRRFATTMMTWKAAGYCHKPLYFEDWSLERYGHSHGPLADPFFSAAHFFVTLPVLPYKMGVELPWECVYPLGYYRPGSCAPWTVPAVPMSCRGFAVQAATVTGIVFALP